MENASPKSIRLSPLSHLARVFHDEPFKAVLALAFGLIVMIYDSSTCVIFALMALFIVVIDRRIQKLEDHYWCIQNCNGDGGQFCFESNRTHDSNTTRGMRRVIEEQNKIQLAIIERRIATAESELQHLTRYNGIGKHSITDTINVQAEFVALRCPKDRFSKAKHCCETIDGILTICDQDLADASTFLNETLISTITAGTVLIYTTKQFEHHFERASSAKPHLMSITDIVEELQSTHEFALIVLDCHTLTSVGKVLKDAKLPSTGILVVRRSDSFQNISEVKLLSTHPDTIVKDADILLERCALALLKILQTKLHESEQTFSEQQRMCFLDIDDLITTLFRNSVIPRSDRLETEMQTIEYPFNIDEAIEKLVCLPAIIGCLKKRGTLQIYVSQSTNESDQEHIHIQLKKHGIAKYNFVYVTSKNLFSSGDSIFGGRGTLGGFVKKLDLPPSVDIRSQRIAERADTGRDSAISFDYTVAALISRHVVQETNAEMLTVGTNQTPIGRIGTLNESDVVDILPVDVDGVNASECDPRFLTELNIKMFSRLKPSPAVHEMNGKPVHIWSAGSKPGVGLIVEQDFRTSNGLRIIIRDRRRDTRFARKGDSGAMICYYDPVTEVLYAVAMLVSEVQPQQGGGVRYTAQILDDGLQKLSLINDCQFLLFEDNDD